MYVRPRGMSARMQTNPPMTYHPKYSALASSPRVTNCGGDRILATHQPPPPTNRHPTHQPSPYPPAVTLGLDPRALHLLNCGMTEEIPLTGGGRTAVSRIGDTVHRQTGPWAPAVHALLRHLQAEGFGGAPRVIGTGFDAEGRETLSYLPGASLHPGPWPDDAMFNLGRMLADFHRASASFVPPADAIWRPWFGRTLGTSPRIIGHGDLGDWNIIAQNGQPTGFIDWEQAGPVDPLVELAQLCWP